jgi:hypothetical protein
MMPKFNWTGFTEKMFQQHNSEIGEYEDMMYGGFTVEFGEEFNNAKYIADIHYEYLNSREKGFVLEVYEQNDNGTHGTWVGSIRTIKSSSTYKRFCHRAEDEAIRFAFARMDQMKDGDTNPIILN